jgi:sugar phosphate isomerase/epimerase
MSLRERIGVDLGRKIRLEEGIEWAAKNEVRYIDIQLDTHDNAVTAFDERRAATVRGLREKHGVHLGLHTLSAVNVAEYSPYVSDAVDAYLKSYIDIYGKLGAEWIVVHAGYHFSKDKELRMKAGLERLKRIAEYAETKKARILLENLNKEPEDAEVHYLAHTLEEWRYYWGLLSSSAVRLSFTANHAHLVPEGIERFVDALDVNMVGEVRLADCVRNGYEVHLKPGEGDVDFAALFKSHYTNAFGSLDDMLAGRDRLVALAKEAGVS